MAWTINASYLRDGTLGAYTAGLVAKHLVPAPLAVLASAALMAGLAGFLCSPLVVRGSDLSRLMVTLSPLHAVIDAVTDIQMK